MAVRNLLSGSVLEAFQQWCSWLIPTETTTTQYVSVALNEEGVPIASRVFGDLNLSPEHTSQAEQAAFSIFSQFRLQFKLQPNSLYQIKLTGGKASFVILEGGQLTGQVACASSGYAVVQTEKHLVAVQTAVEHTLEDTVVINFQPFPYFQGEELPDSAPSPMQIETVADSLGFPQTSGFPQTYSEMESYPPSYPTETGSQSDYDLLDSQVDVTNINVEEYSETSGLCRLPIYSLANCSRWNQQLSDKARSLASRYTHWRKARGDGNCYYRSVAISYLEYLCRNSTPHDYFAAFYMKVFKQENVIIPDQLAAHYRNFIPPFKRLYTEKGRGQGLICLQACLQDPDFDLGIVAVFRCLALYALCQLKQHSDFSAFFIEGEDTCEADMGTMGKDAEGMVFQAMANALDAKIVHITLSNAALRDDSFQPQTPGQKVVLHVLLKPGHYDVLYPHAVQLQDQYEYASNSFRNPPVPVQSDTHDYIETI